jgi:hypothetical protein
MYWNYVQRHEHRENHAGEGEERGDFPQEHPAADAVEGHHDRGREEHGRQAAHGRGLVHAAVANRVNGRLGNGGNDKPPTIDAIFYLLIVLAPEILFLGSGVRLKRLNQLLFDELTFRAGDEVQGVHDIRGHRASILYHFALVGGPNRLQALLKGHYLVFARQ